MIQIKQHSSARGIMRKTLEIIANTYKHNLVNRRVDGRPKIERKKINSKKTNSKKTKDLVSPTTTKIES